MANWTNPTASRVTSACFFDEPSNACWFATEDGQLRTFRILGSVSRSLGSGWPDAAAVLPSIDGLNVFIITKTGEVLVVPRREANRAQASLLAAIDVAVVGATRIETDEILILDDSGGIHRVKPRSGETVNLLMLHGAVALAADETAGELLLATAAEVYRFRLSDGTAIGTPLAIAAPITGDVLTLAAHAGGATICDNAGNLSVQNWSGAVDPFSLVCPGATSICRWNSLVIVAAGTKLDLFEWGDDVETLPISAGVDPMVPGGWAAFHVDYAAAGFVQSDVEWFAAEGPEAGTVSVARPAGAPTSAYEHRVLAGAATREFRIVARQLSTGTVIATRCFRVVSIWPDAEVGPPMATTGQQRVYAKGGWGGGPAGPQNINVHPAPEEFRIAVAVFRTKGSTSTIDAEQRITELTDNIIGPGRSVLRYYEETSLRSAPASINPLHPKGTTINLLGGKIFGPIDIGSSWGDLFDPGNMDDSWSAWNPKANTWDILGGEFSAFLQDLGLGASVTQLADAFVLMVLPGTDQPYEMGGKTWPAQWNWAFAADSQIYWKGPSWTTFTRRASVTMPAGFPTGHPTPWTSGEFMSTICHELGHNLGCPDLYQDPYYPAELDEDRYMTGWDLMDSDVPLSHFSLPHRMRLGWISPDWIEVCDFGQNPASRTVTLQAMETLARSGPTAGHKAGVEIRIRDGWNYYFEYRRKQAGKVGDQKMPASQAIVGTDVNQATADEAARPLILLLPEDVDNDGPVLKSANKNYRESDVTNPDRLNDFILTRKNTLLLGDNAVNVQIDYLGAFRAELQITPAPGRGNFKSPDISLDGPAGPETVVKGKVNTIKVRVHNRGTKAAAAVKIRVQWLPFTTAPGPWNLLPNPPTQAIPAHSTREFVLNWSVPASIQANNIEAEHFCVRVDVERYVDPTDPAGSEIVVNNNWAQSNFTTDAVAQGSPSERRVTAVTARNIFPRSAVHSTLIEQTSEHFRTYVDHAWRRLEPHQADVTQIWYESLAGDPLGGRDFQVAFEEASHERGLTNDLTARAFVKPDRYFDSARERWGVQLMIRAGIRTRIRDMNAHGELVTGSVLAVNGELVDRGNVRLIGWPERRPEEQAFADAQVDAQGAFRLLVPPPLLGAAQQDAVHLMIFYHGSSRFARSQSKEFRLS
jgi:hypothetical protein